MWLGPAGSLSCCALRGETSARATTLSAECEEQYSLISRDLEINVGPVSIIIDVTVFSLVNWVN